MDQPVKRANSDAVKNQINAGVSSSDSDLTLDGSAAATPSAAEPTTELRAIGPYMLIRRLGEGGMGQVWLAEQTAPIQRQVALKLIRVGIYDDEVAAALPCRAAVAGHHGSSRHRTTLKIR